MKKHSPRGCWTTTQSFVVEIISPPLDRFNDRPSLRTISSQLSQSNFANCSVAGRQPVNAVEEVEVNSLMASAAMKRSKNEPKIIVAVFYTNPCLQFVTTTAWSTFGWDSSPQLTVLLPLLNYHKNPILSGIFGLVHKESSRLFLPLAKQLLFLAVMYGADGGSASAMLRNERHGCLRCQISKKRSSSGLLYNSQLRMLWVILIKILVKF